MGTQRIHKSFSWPAYVVMFQSLALLPVRVCVVAQCPGSGEYMQLAVTLTVQVLLHLGLFKWLHHCVNFALTQETFFAFLEYNYK